jgi:hypothetical protein
MPVCSFKGPILLNGILAITVEQGLAHLGAGGQIIRRWHNLVLERWRIGLNKESFF